MQLPPTHSRVAEHTSDAVNREIHEKTQRNIQYYGRHPDRITQRLRELEREWDIERALQTNASSLIVAGSALGFLRSKGYFAVPLVVGSFLLQHALQGWCPPLAVLRRLGLRTTSEIEQERSALQGISSSRH